MKNFIYLLLLLASSIIYSQDIDLSITKNSIKTNITSALLRNYSLQYERSLSKRFSLAVQYRFMPNGDIPLKNSIENYIETEDADDDEVLNFLKKSQIKGYAVTPEVRWYLGKGYGKGFYIAPYYRYAQFNLESIPINFTLDSGTEEEAIAKIETKSHSYGLLLGVQWKIKNKFTIDWYILGAHTGNLNGDLNATASRNLTATEQQDLQQAIDDFQIDFLDFELKHTVKSNGVLTSFTGSNIGLRSGISIGYSF